MLGFGVGGVQALSPPVPVQRAAPIGWETRITPGFDPPIEYEIVYAQPGYGEESAKSRKEIIASWGPNAFGVLKALAEDPAWAAFRPDIESLMQEVVSEEALDYFETRARNALETPTAQTPDGNALQNALHQLRRVNAVRFRELFDEVFPGAGAEARKPLLYVFTADLLNDTQAAACATRLRAIRDSSTDEKERQIIGSALTNYETRLRADEPMQRILDAERGKEKQP